MNYPDLLKQSYAAVTRRAHPDMALPPFIPRPPVTGRVFVIGAGKASGAMARAFEQQYKGDIEDSLIITRYGCRLPTDRLNVIEAAHPTPDDIGRQGVELMLGMLGKAGPDDLVICLISGGGSSLLSAPVDGLEFADLQVLNQALLHSGADITTMNCVRKHLNKALGGGLVKAANGAKFITLSISDVVGDDKAVIASGATVGDPSTLNDALSILKSLRIDIKDSILQALAEQGNETLKPDDVALDGHEYHLICTPNDILKTAQEFWQGHGFEVLNLGDQIEGDTQDAAHSQISYLRALANQRNDSKPLAVISGGETTVQVTGDGQGGPNAQFMLCAAMALNGYERIYGLACDTDGIDGHGDHAGAFITPGVLEQAKAKELDAAEHLSHNDAYGFFDPLNHLIKTGPSFTNVNDYRVFLLI